MQTSDPLAKRLVESGQWSNADREVFNQEYANGYAASSQQFAYQFVTALADYTAKAFIEGLPEKTNWQKTAQALANGLYGERLDHALICFGAHYFSFSLAVSIIISTEVSEISQFSVAIEFVSNLVSVINSLWTFIGQFLCSLFTPLF